MRHFILYLCLLVLISSCVEPKSYIRSMPYVGLPTTDHPVEIGGTSSLNHIELFSSFMPIEKVNVESQVFLGSRGKIYDFGIGYNYIDEAVHLQLTGGFGRGVVDLSSKVYEQNVGLFEMKNEIYDVDYNKIFLQPTVAIKVSEEVHFGISNRINFLNFKKYEYDADDFILNRSTQLPSQLHLNRPHSVVSDFSIFLKVQRGIFTSFFQIGASTDDSNSTSLVYKRTYFGAGMGIRIGGVYTDIAIPSYQSPRGRRQGKEGYRP